MRLDIPTISGLGRPYGQASQDIAVSLSGLGAPRGQIVIPWQGVRGVAETWITYRQLVYGAVGGIALGALGTWFLLRRKKR